MGSAVSFLTPGLLFLITLASGARLGLSGKPYSTLFFNLHKLIALAAVVLAARQVTLGLQEAGPPAGLLTALLVLAAVSGLALFVTGALMSAGLLSHTRLRVVHTLAPLVLVAALVGAAALLAGKAQ